MRLHEAVSERRLEQMRDLPTVSGREVATYVRLR